MRTLLVVLVVLNCRLLGCGIAPHYERKPWHDYAVVDGKATELPANWAEQFAPKPRAAIGSGWGDPCPEWAMYLRYEGGGYECLPAHNAYRYVEHVKPHRSSRVLRDFQHLHPCPSTGRRTGACPGFVKDHVIPLCAGGPDAVSNMAWQTRKAAYWKDLHEKAYCHHPEEFPNGVDWKEIQHLTDRAQ